MSNLPRSVSFDDHEPSASRSVHSCDAAPAVAPAARSVTVTPVEFGADPFSTEKPRRDGNIEPKRRGSRLMARSNVEVIRAKAFARLYAVHKEKTGMAPWRMRLHRWITEGVWFDRATLALILLNCTALALQDPTGKDDERNRWIENAEHFFSLSFAIEMGIRIAALGLWRPSFAYMRDPWNVFDAVIVITGLATSVASLVFGSRGAAVGSLRAFRLLRPLRAVGHLAEVRFIVASLLHSLPRLADVLLLYFFFILLAGIIAVQLWKGSLSTRCEGTRDGLRPMEEVDAKRVCSSRLRVDRGFNCPWGYECTESSNPNGGKMSYDNLGTALLSLFVAVTMEGWTVQMYDTIDASSFWSALFFVSVILLGTFFVSNLALVMISVAFFQAKEEEQERMEQDPHNGKTVSKMIRADQEHVNRELGSWLVMHDSDLLNDTQSTPAVQSNSSMGERSGAIDPDKALLAAMSDLRRDNRRGTTIDFHIAQAAFSQDVLKSAAKRRKSRLIQKGRWETFADNMRARARCLIATRPFDWFITSSILLNTLFMTLEHHEQGSELSLVLEVANIFFTAVFALETLTKLFGLGWSEFSRDRFNLFDAFVVLMSLLDIVILQQQTGQQSGISVLRTFRLMRIFKLAKQFPTLWVTAKTILRSVEAVSVLTLLLMLVIFIYALLGMQLFGGDFCAANGAAGGCTVPRHNFDNLGFAVLTVFQVITGEDWNIVMYDGMRVADRNVVYFLSLFVLGNYVILNLFIAVLIENFGASSGRPQDVTMWTANHVLEWLHEAPLPDEDEPAGLDALEPKFDPVLNTNLSVGLDGAALLMLTEQDLERVLGIDSEDDRSDLWACLEALRRDQADFEAARESGPLADCRVWIRDLDRRLQRGGSVLDSPQTGPTAVKAGTDKGSGRLSHNDPDLAALLRAIKRTQALDVSPANWQRTLSAAVRRALRGANASVAAPVLRAHGWDGERLPHDVDMGSLHTSLASLARRTPALAPSLSPDPAPGVTADTGNDKSLAQLATAGNLVSFRSGLAPDLNLDSPLCRMGVAESFAADNSQSSEPNERLCCCLPRPPPEPYNVALFCFSSQSRVRQALQAAVLSTVFETVVILLIMVSTAALAMANPLAAPDEAIPTAIATIDLILLVGFSTEALLKILAHGFILAPESYIRRDPWNRLDFGIVLCSLTGYFFTQAGGSEELKMFRMLRTLRPLRFINRSEGLKLVVVALLSAIPPLANIAVIMTLIFVIFGIMGVQFFKGSFYACTNATWGDVPEFTTLTECLAADPAYRWEVNWDNYDNLANALLALFQMTTLEGWVVQMYLGMDAVGPEETPQQNNQPWMAVYFVVFVIVCCFFIINLFVGVLIEQYNETKDEMERARGVALTDDQRCWMAVHDMILSNVGPMGTDSGGNSSFRLHCKSVVLHPRFDRVITTCIVVNILFMCTEHRGQGDTWVYVLDVVNWVFIGVFGVEAMLKLAAFGVPGYFQDSWNRFDFSIVAVSVVGLVMQLALEDAPVLSVFRVLRLARLTRVIKTAVGVRKLLRTLWLALPGLVNVGALLLLLYFMYAVAGMVTFGRVKRGECISDLANFDNFGSAMLLLFRASTGESWQLCMKDLSVQPPDCDRDLGECGEPTSALLFFLSFIVVGKYIVLNVFVAIILSDYENVEHEGEDVLTPDDIQRFTLEWDRRDMSGSRLLPTQELPVFLRRIGPPLGSSPCSDPVAARLDRNAMMRVLGSQCMEYDGKVFYQEVLVTLVEHNVLRPRWDEERGMEIPDRNLWQDRVKRYSRRWRQELQYRPPDKCRRGPVQHALAALRIQTVWRGRRGRLQAEAAAEARTDGWRETAALLPDGRSLLSPIVVARSIRRTSARLLRTASNQLRRIGSQNSNSGRLSSAGSSQLMSSRSSVGPVTRNTSFRQRSSQAVGGTSGILTRGDTLSTDDRGVTSLVDQAFSFASSPAWSASTAPRRVSVSQLAPGADPIFQGQEHTPKNPLTTKRASRMHGNNGAAHQEFPDLPLEGSVEMSSAQPADTSSQG
eukprot:TRINITY_DN4422_c0_g2_i1.p1 TRINITY_DN4422_c0_g2~~TRINITY_DN4422_c0_g2_i1.p1  ORF type:complete len:2025 (+),score=759.03 TRINITY_DN4422_c0_g2_i1:77-6151(+)